MCTQKEQAACVLVKNSSFHTLEVVDYSPFVLSNWVVQANLTLVA